MKWQDRENRRICLYNLKGLLLLNNQIQNFLNIIVLKMTNLIEYPFTSNFIQVSKAESTDDECSRDSSEQKTYKTNLCKYKTQMCKNFSQMGYCPYRSKCQFAHGLHQMSNSGNNQKKAYRTKKCKSFWEEGVCRYGFRCQFLHYDKNQENQKKFLNIACSMLCSSTNHANHGKSRLSAITEISRN